LGLEVAYSPHGVLLSQKKYTSDLLRAAPTDQRIAKSPMELHLKLSSTDGEVLPNPTRYC